MCTDTALFSRAFYFLSSCLSQVGAVLMLGQGRSQEGVSPRLGHTRGLRQVPAAPLSPPSRMSPTVPLPSSCHSSSHCLMASTWANQTVLRQVPKKPSHEVQTEVI